MSSATSPDWKRVREVFERALDEQPADVESWLVREESNVTVRREVASLLSHHSQAGAFMDAPLVERLPGLLDPEWSEPSIAPGQQIGPYQIVRELGRGGMGRVFLATDTRLARTVALKAVAPALSGSAAQRERLRREARAAAGLTHPGICTVYALEEFDDELYIASEYVDGRTLREELAERGAGRVPGVQDVRDTARQLAGGLAAAHAKGIVHRDLKPENVMRTSDGRLKILDFGLARVDEPAGPAAHVTQPGMLVGTPAYMAPEQLKGEAVDARTDVFALGVLLYEYATGVHPFEASTPLARVARVLDSNVRAIGTVRVDLPPALARAIERCLRKLPVERFASAADLLAALDNPDGASAPDGVSAWWRTHQVVAIGLYTLASIAGWVSKEWLHGTAGPWFVTIGVMATIAGVFRGHLLFTERLNRASLAAERRRAERVTGVADLVIAAALALDGLGLAPDRPVAGVLIIALAVGIALARLIVERSTSNAAFGEST